MDLKISVTTRCNAKCITCPVWTYPGEDMSVENFFKLYYKALNSQIITRILINNTGDIYNHPDRKAIFGLLKKYHQKPLIMTTNAGLMDEVPDIDVLIISFNGGTRETYEKVTGLNYNETLRNIRKAYKEIIDKHIYAEINCLIFEDNKGTEKDLKKLFSDFPGRVRVSYKYDNQMKEDRTLLAHKTFRRIPCDYLGMFSVLPSGKIISCAHDFEGKTDFGDAFSDQSFEMLMVNRARMTMIHKHKMLSFEGLCEKCNYNTPIGNRIVFLK